ncbi:serine/threonine-protein kinase [Streptomyces sp. Tu 3180]|uniref:serine/threonine-protein kinase n=1 Tax=Streptomyces sp. Tu 3180 TaxID=2682611 RepID=UPI001359B183|nr:serine/threonine-protein kinase [Streptomyces sp. Tu 3180]KAF3463829.1 serine/threonine protein kinase [Streptomyces sp. Tu 3180]
MGDSRLIHGRYRLLDEIGRGGMGEVWRARDESLGRQVAVKCLRPLGPQHERSAGRVLRERFRREARVAAALQHRGITVVHDFGESEGVLYLVMELLQGRNLSQLLEDNKQHPLPVDEVVDIAEQVADALAHTHDQGIVHRDLKPANIVRLDDGTVKICDFGIARLGHDIGFTSRLTGTGVAMGTPHYMSPEQISGSEVDRRSDLYSFGCVLYEIATGVPPFDLDDAWAILVGHRDTPPRPPRGHRAELPERLERVILDLLAKEPDGRPDSAREVVRRLTALRTAPQPVPAAVAAREESGTAGDAAGPAPAGRAARLPSWTRGMTTGHKAAGTGLRTTPPDPAAGLSGEWIARSAAGRDEEPAPDERPAPSPPALTALAGRHNAGLSLGRLGRWTEAGEVHRAVAAEREHLLGPDHPDTLASRYEVAFALSRTGRAADALRAYKQVAEARIRTRGADHPDTLAARQEMAYVLAQLGRPFDAHQVYLSVLAARERTMGPDHPDTLRCRHNLAFNLGRLGRLEDSYGMACEVAAARARVLGPEHPDTLVTRYDIAYTLGRLGRWAEALETYREVAEARARALGPDHADTLAARYETGVGLGRLGRVPEALELYRGLVEDRTRVQGPAHPETLRARHGLGVSLGRLGRWEEALAESRDVCALRERALGADHPDTLVSRREVAVGLGWLGRWADALTEYRRVAETRERLLGADHPGTLAARDDEAHCLERLGLGAEAAELHRRVAALHRRRAAGRT